MKDKKNEDALIAGRLPFRMNAIGVNFNDQIDHVMSAGTVILMQMRRIVRQFREAGANHASAAIVPSEHNIRKSFAFSRLVSRGVLVAVGNERFYLDEDAEAKFRRQRQRVVFVLVILVIVGIIISLLVSK